jgi:UDP-GlcNAc:undecaprenyl-phosphate/decaprenyl-phosphate GlcNAc-1-phosphate transferase
MENILLSAVLAFVITFFSIPVIIEVAINRGLLDKPDERKIHSALVPTLGGLGIFAGFILATLLGVPSAIPPVFQYFVAAIMVIFFLGIKDDIIVLSATKKFIGQLIAAAIIIKFGGVQINDMHGFLGIHQIPASGGFLLTLFTIVVITNSFNLIDGIDGLAGSLGLMTSALFGTYFLITAQYMYAVMAFSLVGSLLAFLIYNFSPAKIFMGDTGSLLIGLLNAIFVIKFIDIASDPSFGFPIEAAPAVGFAVLIVPLFDTLRVVTIRVINRRSPFCPDRNHIHHLLLGLGFSHTQITMMCLTTNLLCVGLAFYIRSWGTTALMFTLSAVSIVLVSIVYFSRTRVRRLSKTVLSQNDSLIGTHKILTISSDPIEQN